MRPTNLNSQPAGPAATTRRSAFLPHGKVAIMGHCPGLWGDLEPPEGFLPEPGRPLVVGGLPAQDRPPGGGAGRER